MINETSVITEIFNRPIFQRTTETLIEMCSLGNTEQAAYLYKSFQTKMSFRSKAEVFRFLETRLDQATELTEVNFEGMSNPQLLRDILWQLYIAKNKIQISQQLPHEELQFVLAFGSKLRGLEDHLRHQTTSLDCEQRIAFWADDSQSNSQRETFIKKAYGSEHIKAIPISPDWKKRRDWLYSLYPHTSVPNTEKRLVELTTPDLKILFEIGPNLAREIEAGRASLDNQGRLLLPAQSKHQQSIERWERAAELLFLVTPGIFKSAHQNPGVVLCDKLVLLERTRKDLLDRGVVKKAYREKAKAHHPDTVKIDSEAMKRINFVYEVLESPQKFEDWKSGKIYF